jgi:hypothetical protein
MSSIIKGKKDIFNQISVFTSLKDIELKPNNQFNSIGSINNSKDIVPFLLDLSTSLVGSDGLENKFGLLFTQFISEYEVKSKELIKNQFSGVNSNQQLPSSFVNNGINIPIKNLDDSGNLKTSKTDPLGELIYDDTSDNLTTKLKNSIISPGSNIQYNNLNIVYNENTQSINVKPLGSVTVSSFIQQYINNIPKVNKKEIVSDILNNIYGLKSKLQNKTTSEIRKEVEIDFIIDKIINDDSLSFNEDDILEINKISDELFKGFNEIDLGCGFIINEITEEELIDISNSIASSNDPFLISNSVNDLFLNSLDENSDESNTTNLKDSFIKRLINLLKARIIKDIIFSPDKKLLFYLNKSIQSNQNIDFNKNSIDFISENLNLINCITDEIKSLFIEYIFNLVKTEILEVTKPALQLIIKEKINNYSIILKSLLNK